MFPTPCWSFFLPETGRFPCFPRLWYTPCAFPGMQLLLAKYAPIHISQTAAGDVRRYYFSHLTTILWPVIMMTVMMMMMMKANCCSKDKGWATVRSRRGVIRTRGGKLRQWVGASQSQYQFQLPPALTLGRRFSLRAKVIQFWFEFGMFDNCNKKFLMFSLQAADWAQFRCKRFWEQYWSHQENLASTALRPTIGRLGRQYKHI